MVHNHRTLDINELPARAPNWKGLNSKPLQISDNTPQGAATSIASTFASKGCEMGERLFAQDSRTGRKKPKAEANQSSGAFGQGWAADSLGTVVKRYKPRPPLRGSCYRSEAQASIFCKSGSVVLVCPRVTTYSWRVHSSPVGPHCQNHWIGPSKVASFYTETLLVQDEDWQGDPLLAVGNPCHFNPGKAGGKGVRTHHPGVAQNMDLWLNMSAGCYPGMTGPEGMGSWTLFNRKTRKDFLGRKINKEIKTSLKIQSAKT